MVQADVVWEDGTDVVASPRQVLKASSPGWPTPGWQRTPGPNSSSSSSPTPTNRRGPVGTGI